MLARGKLAAAALLTALLLWLWMGLDGSSPSSKPEALEETASTSVLPAATLVERFDRSAAEETITADSITAADDAPAAATGMLRGLVLDSDEEPVAEAAVSVIQDLHDGAERRARWAKTNGDGYFEIPSIPAGTWSMRLTRRGPRQTQGEWCRGDVAVFAGQATWLDVSLAGTRTLTGRFLVPGEDGLGLSLVLRSADPPQQEVGESTAIMSAELDELESGEDANPGEARSGEFWFWGLAPARYELFVYLDLPRRHWVRRSVDLRHGNGDLGTEVLHWEDFFAESASSALAPPR